jgi:uncharacterized membrane protein YedE/YeeE
MGASGILSTIVIKPRKTWNSQSWKYIFVGSFIGATRLYLLVEPNVLQESGGVLPLNLWGYLTSGFLVGFGTKLGNGCTSGHGIAGLARLSRRSFVAVGTFMALGVTTASLVSLNAQQSWWTMLLFNDSSAELTNSSTLLPSLIFGVVPVILAIWNVIFKPSKAFIGAAMSGALFAAGLGLSQMVLRSKVLSFLDLTGFASGTYDPSLMLVIGGGLLTSFAGYFIKGKCCNAKPLLSEEYNLPCNSIVDTPLVLGACLFGIGWGLGGLCPGPAMFQAAAGIPPVVYLWMPAFWVGSILASSAADGWASLTLGDSDDKTSQEVDSRTASEDQTLKDSQGRMINHIDYNSLLLT